MKTLLRKHHATLVTLIGRHAPAEIHRCLKYEWALLSLENVRIKCENIKYSRDKYLKIVLNLSKFHLNCGNFKEDNGFFRTKINISTAPSKESLMKMEMCTIHTF